MAVLESKCSNLIIGLGDTVLVHNLAENTTADIKISQSNSNYKENICVIAFSRTCEYLAIITDQKVLLMYSKTNSNYHCKNKYSMQRAASAIRFSENSSKLIIADKTGDVYLAEEKNEWQPNLILGHLSMLLDILITPDDKCIISCDRDEKIRVTAYPDTFNIISYCLGHEEFVSSLAMLTEYPDVLFSASGDATLRAWHYPTGQQLLCIKFSRPVVAMNVTVIGENIIAIVSLYKSCDVNICCISFTITNCMKCKVLQTIRLPAEPTTFTLFEKSLWFLGSNYLKKFQFNAERMLYGEDDNLTCPVVKQLLSQSKCPELHDSVASLFKKQYNNVEEYHRRKKMRINKGI